MCQKAARRQPATCQKVVRQQPLTCQRVARKRPVTCQKAARQRPLKVGCLLVIGNLYRAASKETNNSLCSLVQREKSVIVLYLYIYVALLAVHTNQKRFQCERPREKRAVWRERKEALGQGPWASSLVVQ